MTAPAATVDRAARREEAVVSAVIVFGVALVHLVQAYSITTLPDAVYRAVKGVAGRETALLAVDVMPMVTLAVVLVIYARVRSRGWLGAAVVLASGALIYARDLGSRRLVAGGYESLSVHYLDATRWMLTLLIPLAAALGWGLARRQGRGWWPGLAAAAVAVPLRLLDLGHTGSTQTSALGLALVLHVVPAVLAGLACWWLELRAVAARRPRGGKHR